MFAVESRFQFIRHFVGNRQVADAVLDDLLNREGCTNPEYVELVECDSGSWDPGGVLWAAGQRHTFDLGETQIEVYLYHLPAFVDWLLSPDTQQVREHNGVKYHKIHSGYMACVCVTPEEFKKLMEQVQDPELGFRAVAEQEARMLILEQASIVSAARVTDDEGNERIAIVKPKPPTLN